MQVTDFPSHARSFVTNASNRGYTNLYNSIIVDTLWTEQRTGVTIRVAVCFGVKFSDTFVTPCPGAT